MSNNKRSRVWNYFDKNSNNSATCNKCQKSYSVAQGNTSTLHRHLLSMHQIDASKDESEPKAKILKPLDNFIIKTTLEELVSKLVTVDGFSIRGITRSEFIRQSMNLRGYKLPKDEKSVMIRVRTLPGTIFLNCKQFLYEITIETLR